VNEFGTVVSAVLPVFCLALTGVLLRRRQWLTEEADASLMRVVVNVLTPALILDKVLGNAALHRPENLLLPPVLGFAGASLGIGIAWLLRRRAVRGTDAEQRTFAATTGIQNYGYVPLPLVEQLFPGNTTGVLLVHNLGVDIALWSAALIALGHAGFRQWKRLINPPIVAVLGAVVLNALGAGHWMPRFALTTAKMLGACCFPLGIVLTGAILSDSFAEIRRSPNARVVVWGCAVRLGLLPALLLAIAWMVPASRELKEVLVVQAAMPAGVFPIVLARIYGGSPATAIRIVIGTSLVGFATIPLWLRLGMRLLDLAGH
jgi:malate permease and related proteins